MDIDRLVTGPLQVNTYFVPVAQAGNDLVIVDPGGNEDLIFSYIKKVKLNPIAIVLTHGHFDHIGAIPALKKAYPKIQIGIHREDSFYLGENAYSEHYADFVAMGASGLVKELEARFPELPEPDFFLEDKKEPACLPGWKVLYTPGHSAGSVCLYNQKNAVLLSGDTLFFRACGRTDLHGGDAQKMQFSLRKLLNLPSSIQVYPGHGEQTNIADEQRNYGF